MGSAFARMGRALLRCAVKSAVLLLAVSVISFALVSASPVDPVQQYILGMGVFSPEQRSELEEYWGINDPPAERYLNWLRSLLHGDFGRSLLYRRLVLDIIRERFSNSLALMMCAWLLSGIIGYTLGCVIGINQGNTADKILKKICYTLSSIPSFWLGLMLLLVFAVRLGWFPLGFSSPIGVVSSNVTFTQRLRHLFLPALTLSLTSLPNIALHTRQKLASVMASEYVLFARARGEGDHLIFFRHGLRNTLLPALTLQFTSFAELFGGSVLAENVFSYPGLGSAVVAAGLNGDVPLLLGITLFSALFVCVGNMIADLLYGIVDPRITEGQI